MYAGCGFAGDFAGDPLLTIASGAFCYWTDLGRGTIRATWSAAGGLPGLTWYFYDNGVVKQNAPPSQAGPAVPAGVVPPLAAVACNSAINTAYDPLGGQKLANISRVLTPFKHTLRGQFRMDDSSLNRYELYRGVDVNPDFTAAAWQTFAALPFTTPVLASGHTYNFVLRKRNIHNLVSQNISAYSLVLDGSSNSVLYPSAPSFQAMAQAAGGAALVTATYNSINDAVGTVADTWCVWLTSDGSTPNTASAPTYTTPIVQADGQPKLSYTSALFATGTVLKAIVRVRRTGTPNYDSQNTAIMQITANATGPVIPAAAGAFFGEAALSNNPSLPAGVAGAIHGVQQLRPRPGPIPPRNNSRPEGRTKFP